MPKNNKKATVRTLLFVMISVMLIHCAQGTGGVWMKRGGIEHLLPTAFKEVISWIVPA